MDVKYIYKSENTGGAGGFYTGMKAAYDEGYEWLWMMDDDGFPAKDGLQQIYFYSKKHNLYFSNALVISIEDRFSLSFDVLQGKENRQEYEEIDVIYDYITPFNGTLINRTLPENIGFIKKEMFIWGDEQEYLRRTLKNNYAIGTVVKSIHYHPKEKGDMRQVFPFSKKYKILLKPENRSYIYYRNLAYIYCTYLKKDAFRLFLLILLYYLFRFRFIKAIRFLIAWKDGYQNKF
jgi:rhamnopyranosyl-N-acetylglucosaminyl-diphospho-decaprenol beta-1,3/1,4-galactofuranosyltransferase